MLNEGNFDEKLDLEIFKTSCFKTLKITPAMTKLDQSPINQQVYMQQLILPILMILIK